MSTENGEETAMGMYCCWRPRQRPWTPTVGPRRLDICHGGTGGQICPDTCPVTGAENRGGRAAGCGSAGAGSLMEGKLPGEEARLESEANSAGCPGHEVT